MAEVTLAGGTTGTNIVISGADRLFQIKDGEVEFSTDSFTTIVRVAAGSEITFYDGTTVSVRNTRPVSAAFAHMAY